MPAWQSRWQHHACMATGSRARQEVNSILHGVRGRAAQPRDRAPRARPPPRVVHG